MQAQSNHRFEIIQGGKSRRVSTTKPKAAVDRRMEKAREEFFTMVREAKAFNEARRVATR